MPHARCAKVEEFFDDVAAASGDLPTYRGELNTVFEGCYTSHGDVKKLNRQGENMLLSTETVGALAHLAAGFARRGGRRPDTSPRADYKSSAQTVNFH